MTAKESFFTALKAHRESKKIQILEISEFTKIQPKYIEAIENGDFNILPNVYMRLFIKSYVIFLGLDPNKALKDYELYTTGKINNDKQEAINKENFSVVKNSNEEVAISNSPDMFQQKIITGTIVIIALLSILWWAGKISNESVNTEQIEKNNKQPTIPRQGFNLDDSIIDSTTEFNFKENQNYINNKLPLNSNDFLRENQVSELTKKIQLSYPFSISINTLQETKINISKVQGLEIIEVINEVVQANQELIYNFESTINFEFWDNSHVNIKLNSKSIDNFLISEKMTIRGSYEADKNMLYLSFFKR